MDPSRIAFGASPPVIESAVICVRVAANTSRDDGQAGTAVAEALVDLGLPVEHCRGGALLAATLRGSRGDGLLAYAAKRVLDHAQRRTGAAGVAGAGRTRALAFLATSLASPDGLFVLAQPEVPTMAWPLPAGRLPGAGPREVVRLRGTGAETVGDVAALGPVRCMRLLGPAGRALWLAAYGRDRVPLPMPPANPRPLSLFAAGSLDVVHLLARTDGADRRPAAPDLRHAG